MTEKRLKGKVVHKHELEAHWLESSYVPEKGELVVYAAEVDKEGNVLELPEGRETPYTYPRMKLGDGVHNVNELEFSGGAENMVLFGDGELIPDEPVQPDEPDEPVQPEGQEQLAYELSADDTYYIVTGRGTVKSNQIVIPDTYEGKPVIAIKENAFKDDAGITKFTVGKYVMFIAIGNIETWTNCTELYFTAEFGEDFAQKYQLYTGSEIYNADCGYSPYTEYYMYKFVHLGYFSNEDGYVAFNDHIGANKYQDWLEIYNGGGGLDTGETYDGTGVICSAL